MPVLSTLLLVFCFIVSKGQLYIPVDKPGAVTFIIKNFGLDVEGELKGLQGKIIVDRSHIEKSSFEISVNTSSVDTGIGLRDRHLKKEEYFNSHNYAIIQFVSSEVKKAPTDNVWIVSGELTIKSKMKQIQFPFTVKDDGKIEFKGQFKINCKDFGVGSKSLGMSDSVMVNLRVTGSRVLGN